MIKLTDEVMAAAWDCHVHVFDPARYPLALDRRYTPGAALTEDLERHLDDLGMGRVVLVQPSPYGIDNRCLLDALSALGTDRARGIAVLDPSEITPERIAALHAAGIRGLRCNFKTTGQTDISAAASVLERIDDRLGETPWVVQIFTPLSMNLALSSTFARLSRPVILDHFAGMTTADFDGSEQAVLFDLLAAPNVILKLSAAHRVVGHQSTANPLQQIAKHLVASVPQQLIWGTDWPHTGSSPSRQTRPITEIEPFENIDDHAALKASMNWSFSSTRQNGFLQADLHHEDWKRRPV